MVDGTGVGYNTPFYLRSKRGLEIRKIRSHVKLVVFCYWQGGRNWVVDVEVGKAYSDEGLLPYGTNIVGDKLYGMRVDVLRKMESLGYEPIVRSEDTMRVKVKSEERRRANQRAKEKERILKGRYRIEQVFGSIKRAYGSYLDVKGEPVAKLMVLGMFILRNMAGLLRLVKSLFSFTWLYSGAFGLFLEHSQYF